MALHACLIACSTALSCILQSLTPHLPLLMPSPDECLLLSEGGQIGCMGGGQFSLLPSCLQSGS